MYEEEIPRAAKYSVTVIQKRHAELFREAMLEDPAMAATFTEDERGGLKSAGLQVRMGKPSEAGH